MFGRTIFNKIVLAHFIPLGYIIHHFIPQNKQPLPPKTVDKYWVVITTKKSLKSFEFQALLIIFLFKINGGLKQTNQLF
ncbi:MAG: hypothetical protein US04_C0001G0109 [Candidatus Nomurabacteria bacterium GW2011_GWD2_36_14]|nr:MAG: hypothetical protein UR97_C0004G0134 [Candidatus Nomurabacteria bacterium GW2011_GWE2_36_115]KKP94265.1 MAG: hypothetical protein US00_C0003G0189 [Candidatus Nomurabacteria bacterium GW2011_GWF2_36_126]KKP96607.1 MAG: hypothetical protein US04_C0001G0109 [Candidatus Nomurabacteria bacterium GW2011_GWD2_36_14]KKP99789.1 MAG: hypothetical protein US08_C0001G0472 [Candidatus Nomurabacteria bacterium GW2011_GWF2_36_19]KKQ05265.1 MAG: hypothetical protein US17_C0005G0032 [Candidatus Nomuraba